MILIVFIVAQPFAQHAQVIIHSIILWRKNVYLNV